MSEHGGVSAVGALPGGRSAHATLSFAAGGGRTFLSRQSVPYPFHVTRTFDLDRARPNITTLYLQSASGGLYRDDDLTLDITARAGAFAHVTTQAATMVHDTSTLPARQRVTLDIADGAFLAYTPDPLVLFSNATLVSEIKVTLAPGALAIVTDAFAWHDPKGLARPFGTLTQLLEIGHHEDQGRLVRERGLVRGLDTNGVNSPLGPFRALGTMLILGPPSVLPKTAVLQHACDQAHCLGGASDLPNGVGRILRCIAEDGCDLRRGLEAAFHIAFEALVGVAPAIRRK